VEDSRKALDSYDIPADSEEEVTDRLDAAEEHLDVAEEKLNAAVPTIIARANAVKEYGKAWQDAQSAIDILDQEVSPEVEITDATYTPKEDYIQVSLEGNVRDIRAYEYDNATAFLNGEEYTGVELTPILQGAQGLSTFDTELELSQLQKNEIEIRVSKGGQSASDTFTFEAKGFADDTYSLNYTDEETGVSVEVTGDGLAPDDVQITNITPENYSGTFVSPQIEIDNSTAIQNATVSIPIDDSVNLSESNLSIVTWGAGDLNRTQILDANVDEENRMVKVDVDEFSFFGAIIDRRSSIYDFLFRTQDTIVLGSDDESLEDLGLPLESTDGDGIPDIIEREMDLKLPLRLFPRSYFDGQLNLNPNSELTPDYQNELDITDGQLVDIDWSVFEEDGQVKLTAEVEDAIARPDSGVPAIDVQKTVFTGYEIPTYFYADDSEPIVGEFSQGFANTEAYLLQPSSISLNSNGNVEATIGMNVYLASSYGADVDGGEVNVDLRKFDVDGIQGTRTTLNNGEVKEISPKFNVGITGPPITKAPESLGKFEYNIDLSGDIVGDIEESNLEGINKDAPGEFTATSFEKYALIPDDLSERALEIVDESSDELADGIADSKEVITATGFAGKIASGSITLADLGLEALKRGTYGNVPSPESTTQGGVKEYGETLSEYNEEQTEELGTELDTYFTGGEPAEVRGLSNNIVLDATDLEESAQDTVGMAEADVDFNIYEDNGKTDSISLTRTDGGSIRKERIQANLLVRSGDEISVSSANIRGDYWNTNDEITLIPDSLDISKADEVYIEISDPETETLIYSAVKSRGDVVDITVSDLTAEGYTIKGNAEVEILRPDVIDDATSSNTDRTIAAARLDDGEGGASNYLFDVSLDSKVKKDRDFELDVGSEGEYDLEIKLQDLQDDFEEATLVKHLYVGDGYVDLEPLDQETGDDDQEDNTGDDDQEDNTGGGDRENNTGDEDRDCSSSTGRGDSVDSCDDRRDSGR